MQKRNKLENTNSKKFNNSNYIKNIYLIFN